jgi:long-chain fatty acid transport protein
LPNLFVSAPLKQDQWALGLGVTTPYGLAVEWEQGPTSPLTYGAPYQTDLVTVNVNPSMAVRLLPNLSLGFGLNLMTSEVELRQRYPWFVFPGSTGTEPDGDLRVKGDGLGWGANVGVTWEVVPGHRLAVTCRSPMSIDYAGTTRISNVTPVAAGFLGVTPESDFRTEIKYPTIVGAGYGVDVSDRVRLEINGEWLQFSRFQTFPVDVGNNNVLLPTTGLRQDWKDTFTAGVAGDWRFAEDWTVRAGYQFYESPVPDETLSPSIPDANQHVATVGLAWQRGAHGLELAYAYDWYDRRTITNNQNPAFNGTYKIQLHMMALAYRFRF